MFVAELMEIGKTVSKNFDRTSSRSYTSPWMWSAAFENRRHWSIRLLTLLQTEIWPVVLWSGVHQWAQLSADWAANEMITFKWPDLTRQFSDLTKASLCTITIKWLAHASRIMQNITFKLALLFVIQWLLIWSNLRFSGGRLVLILHGLGLWDSLEGFLALFSPPVLPSTQILKNMSKLWFWLLT